MILEKTFYAVQCDNCGAINTNYDDVQYWNEEFFAEDIAKESGWDKKDGKHFCPQCVDNEYDSSS